MAALRLPVRSSFPVSRSPRTILPIMNTAIVWADDYQDHETGSHPESSERIIALRRALQAAGMFDGRLVLEPHPAGADAVLAVHSQAVLDRVRRAAEQGGAWLDPDT